MGSEEILRRMFDIFRGSPLTIEDSSIFVLQILAWAKLSIKKSFSSDLILSRNQKNIPSEKLLDSLHSLIEYSKFGENKAAFENIESMDEAVQRNATFAALDFALNAAQKNLLDHFDIPEELYISLLSKRALFVPKEVIEVMSALAVDLEGKAVYCPYDTFCLIARHVSEKGGSPSVETPWRSPIPWLTSILTDASIHTVVSDPLQQPTFLEKPTFEKSSLQKFDISIAFPPFGNKITEVAWTNLFDRFKEKTSSGSVLYLRHIIAQTEGKAIVAVPSSILFGRRAEHSLRTDLLQHGMIEAVISMPSALLPFEPTPFSILVLNTQGGSPNIRFVNGAAEQFSTKDGKNRSTLVKWTSLIETFKNGIDEAIVADVPVEVVIQNDANLEVSRYLLPPKQKFIQKLFSVSTTRKLKELVEFLRPAKLLPKDEVEGISVLEVSIADFPEYGYLTTPEKQVMLSPKVFSTKEEKSFLRNGDIIIAMKGNLGKLAIIPNSVPPAGHHGWVVNQSCLIMRSKEAIDPCLLFVYLRSDVGQTLLKSIISEATVPLIQLKQLKEIEIIVPDTKEAKSVINTFEKQVQIQAEIEHLKEELQHLNKAHWEIPPSNEKI